MSIASILGVLLVAVSPARERVVLLHGLARTDRSMAPMKTALEQAGFEVANADYPSRTAAIERLSEDAIGQALGDARRDGVTTVHFVTHSLGGILVRSYLSRHTIPELGRVVMLGPPNQGSEVVDALGGWAVFGYLNGPAGKELGTKPDSVPNRLSAVDYSVGVIAGSRSINWINSLMIPGPDDGKVSVERTKVAGMADHIVLPATHPLIMRDEAAIRQTIHFLRFGRFDRTDGVTPRLPKAPKSRTATPAVSFASSGAVDAPPIARPAAGEFFRILPPRRDRLRIGVTPVRPWFRCEINVRSLTLRK